MNIVFHRYGNICEQDILESFLRMGIEVIEDDLEIKCKNIAGEKRIETLGEIILINRPAFVFSINFFPYISEICERLGYIYICLSVDCPILEIYTNSIKNKVNRIFLFDYKQYQSIVDVNPNCIFYLPLATNINRWEKILGDKIQKPDYLYDVSFVGSLYNEMSHYPFLKLNQYDRGYVDGIIEVSRHMEELALAEEVVDDRIAKLLYDSLFEQDLNYANRFELDNLLIDRNRYVAVNYIIGMELSAIERMNILHGLSAFSNVHLFTGSDASLLNEVCVHNRVSTHSEMPIVFSSSKINLNITMRGIQTGLSQRIWDVLGCGGFLLTDYQAEIPEYFENGKDLVCFENEFECGELVDYYLKHDEERKEIARNGFKKVKDLHTYDQRLAQMISMVVNG